MSLINNQHVLIMNIHTYD